jgi:hypothetical protein
MQSDPRPAELQTIVEQHWRAAVLERDGDCIAPLIDKDAGPCRDKWGDVKTFPFPQDELEADYVKLGAHGARHELPIDHVALCPGHHRGTGSQRGYVWATAHRAELRSYLEP